MTGTAAPISNGKKRLPWLSPKFMVATVVIMGAVGFLIYNGMQSSVASYFVTVGELEKQASMMDGERVRVGGNVVPGSIQTGGIADPLRFEVTDGTHSIPVVYKEVVPDIFAEDVEVIVEGTYHVNGEFQAETLLTKCPSKFEAEQASN